MIKKNLNTGSIFSRQATLWNRLSRGCFYDPDDFKKLLPPPPPLSLSLGTTISLINALVCVSLWTCTEGTIIYIEIYYKLSFFAFLKTLYISKSEKILFCVFIQKSRFLTVFDLVADNYAFSKILFHNIIYRISNKTVQNKLGVLAYVSNADTCTETIFRSVFQ